MIDELDSVEKAEGKLTAEDFFSRIGKNETWLIQVVPKFFGINDGINDFNNTSCCAHLLFHGFVFGKT